MKRSVLTFVGGYLPGFRYGGPIRSVSNIVEQLGTEFQFRVVTTDRDYLADQPYAGIEVDHWSTVGNARVFYASPANRTLRAFAQLIRDTPHDVLYLNSFFNPRFTLQPLLARRAGWIESRPTVLAPRGELSSGALAIKRWKKAPFLAAARIGHLYHNIVWHASSEHEREDIVGVLGTSASPIVVAAPDLPTPPVSDREFEEHREKGERLRILFLSRVDPMKNLDFTLRALSKVTVDVDFNIFGPRQNASYWAECERRIGELPTNVAVAYCGEVPPEQVSRVMSEHDLFVLPTRGENFGHVIWEALSAGTPVVISDRTPWKDDGLGGCKVIPLDRTDIYVSEIERIAKMSPHEFRGMRKAARDAAIRFTTESRLLDRTRALFTDALALR